MDRSNGSWPLPTFLCTAQVPERAPRFNHRRWTLSCPPVSGDSARGPRMGKVHEKKVAGLLLYGFPGNP